MSETDPHYNLQQVAMTREKFPEKIPFRLTRMLTNAMEVCNSAVSYAVIHTHMCVLLCVGWLKARKEGCSLQFGKSKTLAEKSF